MGRMLRELHLTGNPDADKLLNDDPFALLVGMLLDQQYPMEHAFSGPLKIANRMDGFDLHKIAATDLETFVELSVTPPAIHRYGGSMARRVHALAQEIIEKYDGETANIWLSGRPKPDGAEVLKRLRALPGFGEQKAKIFLALLGKQRGVAPKGWREAAGSYGDRGSRRSIADVTDAASLAEVRSFKKAAKAAVKA
ncbi:putative HhH-GPD family protein [Kribbella sp. VKM Ac-2569]|nr:putative HhH-GPD family protein [Kribbella sp. VKM Ac-2569]